MRVFPVPTRIGWSICLLVAAFDAALIFALHFSISADGTLLRNVALLVLLAGFSALYAGRPATHNLAVFTSAILYVAVYSIAIVLLSYLLATADMPLLDGLFVRLDKALGFDWQGWLAWMGGHPRLGMALAYAYESQMPQVVLALVLLSFLKHHEALSEYLTLFWLTTVATIVLAALLPAAGAYEYFKPDPRLYAALSPEGGIAHVHQFLGLRDGSFRTIDLTDLNGLVAFPSFHTALAVITAWAFWRVSLVRYIGLLLNGIVVLSTPTQGGHYLVDVIAGGGLAVLFILLVRSPFWAGLTDFLSLPLSFSSFGENNASLAVGADAEADDEQSIRTRSRQEPGQFPASDAAFVSEARG